MKALVALVACAVALVAAPVAGATTYNNDTPIIIPSVGMANPYPSSITVSGTAGPITDVNVGLDDFTHLYPDNVIIALVAPSGLALRMQACAGSTTPVAGVDLTFDDAAAAQIAMPPSPLTTGTFKPTAYCATDFPAPGPPTPANPGPSSGGIATFASVFNGHSAIGTWSLYVFDRLGTQGGGSIPGGWSLDVNPDVTPPPPVGTTPPPAAPPAPVQKKCKKKKGKKSAAASKKKKKGCKKKKKKT